MLKVKVPNHQAQMTKGLYDLQTQGQMCDLQLTSKSIEIDFHKVVLAGMGDLALAKVRSGVKPDGQCSIVVREASVRALTSVIRCLYLGELHFNKEDSQEIIQISEDLGLVKMTSYLKSHPALNNTKQTRSREKKVIVDSQTVPMACKKETLSLTSKRETTLVASKKKTLISKMETTAMTSNTATDLMTSPVETTPMPTKRKTAPEPFPSEILHKTYELKPNSTSIASDGVENGKSKRDIPSEAESVGESSSIKKPALHEDIAGDLGAIVQAGVSNDASVITPDAIGHSEEYPSEPLQAFLNLTIDEECNGPSKASNSTDKKVEKKPNKMSRPGQKSCYKCHKSFESPETCAAHRATCEVKIKRCDKSIIKALPFLCRRCFSRFPTDVALSTHRATCRVKRKRIERKCRKCQVIFDDVEELKAHRKLHSLEWNEAYVRVKQNFPCNLCDYTCTNEKSLLTHQTKEHDKPLTGTDKHPLLHCKTLGCPYKTLFQFQMKNHMSTHTAERAFICEVCGKAFKQRSVLDVHVRTVHTSPKLQCLQCSKHLKTRMALKAHIKRVHQQVKNLACPDCKFKSFDAATMESHRHSKHNVPFPDKHKSYVCEVCGYSTRWKCQHDSHMRRHTGECPFVCKVCQKSFPAKSDLTSHTKWHVEKKYKCSFEQCRYSTCVPGKLKNHIRTVHTHRDVKPFVCDVCDYKTNLRSNLFLHLRKVHKLKVKTRATRVIPIPNASTVPAEQHANPLFNSTVQPFSDQSNKDVAGQRQVENQFQNGDQVETPGNNQTMSQSQELCGAQHLSGDLSTQLTLTGSPDSSLVSVSEDFLSSAAKSYLSRMGGKPVVIQLRSMPDQVISIEQLQEQLQREMLQQQQQQQQQLSAAPCIQVVGTPLSSYTPLTTPDQKVTGELEEKSQLKAVEVSKAEPPVIVEYSPKYPVDDLPSMDAMYPVTAVSPPADAQSAAGLMAPYASLIQVHMDSLQRPATPTMALRSPEDEPAAVGTHEGPRVVQLPQAVFLSDVMKEDSKPLSVE